MYTIRDIMRECICGIFPRSDIGIRMEILSFEMVYDWRY